MTNQMKKGKKFLRKIRYSILALVSDEYCFNSSLPLNSFGIIVASKNEKMIGNVVYRLKDNQIMNFAENTITFDKYIVKIVELNELYKTKHLKKEIKTQLNRLYGTQISSSDFNFTDLPKIP